MGNSIIRGQPWSIRLRLKSEQIVVGNIQGIYLAVVQGANKTVKIFADGVSKWTLNSSQNTVTCQLSAANTNTLTAGIRAGISAHITDTSGEKSEVFAGIYAVENSGSTDVLPDILDANIQSGQTIPDSEIDADLRPATFTNNGTYSPSGFDGYSQVTVNVGAPSGTKQISITENGTITENVANYANAAITTNVVNQDYVNALTALGVQSDLADSIGALTTYANGVTGESDTTLSDAVASLADGYGGGGSITNGIVFNAVNAQGAATEVTFYGDVVPNGMFGRQANTANVRSFPALTTVHLSASVTKIYEHAFRYSAVEVIDGCENVTNINPSNNRSAFANAQALKSVVLPKVSVVPGDTFTSDTALETVVIGSVGNAVTNIVNTAFTGCTQSGLTITIYTTGSYADTAVANTRNKATSATIVIKASEATTYNGTSYSAGDTILTSTPTS